MTAHTPGCEEFRKRLKWHCSLCETAEELLEVLEDVYAPHLAAHPNGECKCPHFAKARAAIAKAKGE